mmetsp:Transcript_37024/g.87998  ORF Transcript_37024/g.87998 Transcript_37024/m.87998 type:complete len:333 (-) Transcript_37024:33-1031(-)
MATVLKDQCVGKGRFQIGAKIGSGSFGEIFVGFDTVQQTTVGIKIEPRGSRQPQLLTESQVYNGLASVRGVPKVVFYGSEGDFNILVMDLLGPSLERLYKHCGRKMSLKTVIMLADQIITRIEAVHSQGVLHRDIKPDNFLMGLGSNANLVYLIDFGLAKRYRDPVTHAHIPYRENKPLTGTARYASVNTHLGIEQSRRDDLEAAGYLFVYLLRGSLPWQGIKEPTRKLRYEKISECKLNTSIETLCTGLPPELLRYFQYCRALDFDDDPNYNHLRKLLRQRFVMEKLQWDYIYDWTILKYHAAIRHQERRRQDQEGRAPDASGTPPANARQ